MPTENPEISVGRRRSPHSVAETVAKLKTALIARGVTLFAIIDHAAEAEKAGLIMPPTQVVLFGSPSAGTPLMLAAPALALDLPLRILVAEENGETWLSWNSLPYFEQRHGLSLVQLAPLDAAGRLAEAATL